MLMVAGCLLLLLGAGGEGPSRRAVRDGPGEEEEEEAKARRMTWLTGWSTRRWPPHMAYPCWKWLLLTELVLVWTVGGHQVTQRILASVMERAPSAGIGERVMVEGSSKPVVLGRRVSPAELKRLRRQFLKQAVALETAGEIAETFVEFLNTNIG